MSRPRGTGEQNDLSLGDLIQQASATGGTRASGPSGVRLVLALVAGFTVLAVLLAAASTKAWSTLTATAFGTEMPTPTSRPRATPTAQRAAFTTTPADKVVEDLLGGSETEVLGDGWSADPAAMGVQAFSFPAACIRKNPAGTSPFTGSSRTGRRAESSVRIDALAYGAGQGSRAVEQLRSTLDTCGDPVAPVQLDDTPMEGTQGFRARTRRGGETISWGVWRRGDLVLSVTATRFGSENDADIGDLATHLDPRAVAALKGVCPGAGSVGDGQANANPYAAGSLWTQRTAPMAVPGMPPLAAPKGVDVGSIPVDLPGQTSHPDLAPYVLPPRASWSDSNGDGVPEPPPLASLSRGSAPVFADPGAFPSLDRFVRDEPTAPEQPAQPDQASIQVPIPDSTGPGCGWAFTGQPAPAQDRATIDRLAVRARTSGLDALSKSWAEYEVELAQWQVDQQRYATDMASYNAYRTLRDALGNAESEQQNARDRYNGSINDWKAAVAAARPRPTSTPRPTSSGTTSASTSPTPTPTATTPAPTTTPPPTTPGPTPTVGGPSPAKPSAPRPATPRTQRGGVR